MNGVVFQTKNTIKSMAEIKDIIAKYEQLDTSEPINLPKLLNLKKELSIATFNLSVKCGSFGRNFYKCEQDRKVSFHKAKLEAIESGESAAKSDSIAESKIGELRAKEALNEATYRGLKEIINSVTHVLATMSKEIDNLNAIK